MGRRDVVEAEREIVPSGLGVQPSVAHSCPKWPCVYRASEIVVDVQSEFGPVQRAFHMVEAVRRHEKDAAVLWRVIAVGERNLGLRWRSLQAEIHPRKQ